MAKIAGDDTNCVLLGKIRGYCFSVDLFLLLVDSSYKNGND